MSLKDTPSGKKGSDGKTTSDSKPISDRKRDSETKGALDISSSIFSISLDSPMSADASTSFVSLGHFSKIRNQIQVQEAVTKSAEAFGFKSANLLELQKLCALIQSKDTSLRAKVPSICPLSHDLVYAHIRKHGAEFDALWKQFVSNQGQETQTITQSAQRTLAQIQKLIREIFIKNPLSLDTKELAPLKDYLSTLNPEVDLLMVRSTGKEDTAEIANPGGNVSVSAVKPDAASISNAIGEVVASYFSEKSNKQRLLGKDDITKPPFMPSLLQRMVGESIGGSKEAAEIVRSGVMYTGARGTRIQVAPGHGELIVNSKAPFDTYYVTQELVPHAEIHDKTDRLVPVLKEGSEKIELIMQKNDPKLRKSPAISPRVAQRIAKIGQYVEEYYGEPMDVEFVYNVEEDTVYLVQARPIPTGDLKLVMPSSIKPEKLAEVDEKGQVLKGTVVTPAGSAAKIITAKSEVLVYNTIEEALTFYLHHTPKTDVKAVIILNDAPETSHEAAQFNSKAIPVIKVNNIEIVKQWLEEDNIALIIDPQRKQVINWASQVIGSPENKLKTITEELLAEGFFKSHMSARETVLEHPFARKKFYSTPDLKPLNFKGEIGFLAQQAASSNPKESANALHVLMKVLFSALQIKDSSSPLRVAKFSQMAKLIENIENAVPGKSNTEAFESLKIILNTFMVAIHPKKSGIKNASKIEKDLFRQAMITGGEIYEALKEMQTMEQKFTLPTNLREARQALLNLAVKLEGLITAPPEIGVNTSSLYQVALNRKIVAEASSFPGFDTLNIDQKEFFVALSQLHKLALNQPLGQEWIAFAFEICLDRKKLSEITLLMMKLKKYNIAAEWLNDTFMQIVKTKDPTKLKEKDSKVIEEIYGQLIKEADQIDKELSKQNLDEYTSILKNWQLKLPQWGNEIEFEKLFKAWNAEIVPLITKLNIDSSMHVLTKRAILNVVLNLTELMDNSIKSLKGSPEYKDKDLQARRFALMLAPYNELMKKWTYRIPESKFKEWAAEVVYDPRANNKGIMLAQIESVFLEKVKSVTEASMLPSRFFNVASATIGSPTSFSRHFVELERYLTLEDLFTLMHQNTIAAISQLKGEASLTLEDFPKPLQPMLTALENIECYGNKLKLINMEQKYPNIFLEYNLPLRNHSAKFYVQYDKVSNKCRLSFKIFGHNGGGRMDYISTIMQLFPRLNSLTTAREPRYDTNRFLLEGAWEFDSKHLSVVGKELTDVINSCSYITFYDDRVTPSSRFDAFLRPQIPKMIENNLWIIILKNKSLYDTVFADKVFREDFNKYIAGQFKAGKNIEFMSNLFKSFSSHNADFVMDHVRAYLSGISEQDPGHQKFFKMLSNYPNIFRQPSFMNYFKNQMKNRPISEVCHVITHVAPLQPEFLLKVIADALTERSLNSAVDLLLDAFQKMPKPSPIRKTDIPYRFNFLRSLLRPTVQDESLEASVSEISNEDFAIVLKLAQQELDKPFLFEEISNGHVKMVRKLFSMQNVKTDPNQRDSKGTSALELAIDRQLRSNNKTSAEVIKILLENKADPNVLNSNNEPLLSSLFLREGNYESAVELLLSYRANPNAKMQNGDPILKLALWNPVYMKMLLDKDANPNATDAKGKSIVALAIERAMLPLEPVVSATNVNDYGAIKLLIREGAIKSMKELTMITEDLLKKTTIVNERVMGDQLIDFLNTVTKTTPSEFINHWGVILNSDAIKLYPVRFRLEESLKRELLNNLSATDICDVMRKIPENFVDSFARVLSAHLSARTLSSAELQAILQAFKESKPFMTLALDVKTTLLLSLLKTDLSDESFNLVAKEIELISDKPLLINGIISGNATMVKLLLDRKADSNVLSKEGRSALEWAVRIGNYEIVRMLLAHKADPNTITNTGDPLLAVAVKEGRSTAFLELFIKHGANVNAKTSEGTPILNLALDNTEMLRLLLNNGANPLEKDKEGKSTITRVVERCSADPSKALMISPFLEMKETKELKELKELSELKELQGLEPKIIDQLFEPGNELSARSTIRSLFAQGMSPNAKGSNGESLLIKALKANNISLLYYVLEKKPDLDMKEIIENIAIIKKTKGPSAEAGILKHFLTERNIFYTLTAEQQSLFEEPPPRPRYRTRYR